jgi:hypothetical protein
MLLLNKLRLMTMNYERIELLARGMVSDRSIKEITGKVRTCLGDGHPGIWKIIRQFNCPGERREILDWFHLVENLHKVGGSLKRLKAAETFLWQGKVDETLALS